MKTVGSSNPIRLPFTRRRNIEKTTYSYNSHTNVAMSKKSCHSSATTKDNKVLGSWYLVDPSNACAQTDDLPSDDNWWMIDLEQPITLKFVTILTNTWNTISRLNGMIVAVTNTSWFEDQPQRNYSICFINTPNTFTSSTYYNRNCSPDIMPGRYVLILQGKLKDSTPGYFSLCDFKAYPV